MSPTKKSASGFTPEEKAAMRERARELKQLSSRKQGEADLLSKIKLMSAEDRAIAEGILQIVQKVAPELEPKTWYGMPAWARAGKVVCFFQSKDKFKVRYSTLGFNEDAKLDSGAMWPTSFAVTKLNPAVKKEIADLVKKAIR